MSRLNRCSFAIAPGINITQQFSAADKRRCRTNFGNGFPSVASSVYSPFNPATRYSEAGRTHFTKARFSKPPFRTPAAVHVALNGGISRNDYMCCIYLFRGSVYDASAAINIPRLVILSERSPGNSDAGFLKNSFIAFTAGIAAAVDITVHPARTGEHDARLSDGRRVRIRRISILIRIPAAIEMINFAVDNIDIDGTDGTASPSPSIDAIYRCVFNRDRGLFGKSACAIPTAINPCVTVRFSQIDTAYIDLHILDGNLGARRKVVADSRTVNFHTSGISIRGWIKYASSNIHHDIAHGSRPTIKGTARTPDINAAMVGLNILLHRLKSAARDIDGRSTRH